MVSGLVAMTAGYRNKWKPRRSLHFVRRHVRYVRGKRVFVKAFERGCKRLGHGGEAE